MNRKITKTMAEDAAEKMATDAFSEKINAAIRKKQDFAEVLIRKYIPAPVLACLKEYPAYINFSTYASFATYIGDKAEKSISSSLSTKIPTASTFLIVSNIDYNLLEVLENKRKLLCSQCDELQKELFEAILALRTEKNIEKELPEALKYIDFPVVKQLPVKNYDHLRDILKSLK